MKSTIERRKPRGFLDYSSLAITTFGVGYIPGAPGTYGSAVAVAIYLLIARGFEAAAASSGLFIVNSFGSVLWAMLLVGLVIFGLLGIWGANRSIPLLGNEDPSEAVVDEVLGQFVALLFIPLSANWPFVLAAFLLFRLFDIWKPYPIDSLQSLPGGIGICADDILAGVYAGVCLSVLYAINLSI